MSSVLSQCQDVKLFPGSVEFRDTLVKNNHTTCQIYEDQGCVAPSVANVSGATADIETACQDTNFTPTAGRTASIKCQRVRF